MSSIEYNRSESGEWVKELDYRWSGEGASISHNHTPARHIRLLVGDGQLINDGTDTETITVEVVDGLEVARGTDPANATVLGYDGDATITVDGAELTKTLSNGSVSWDITTQKDAGSTIEVVAESLADYPSDSDAATIEVVQ